MLYPNTDKAIHPVFHALYHEMEYREGIGTWVFNIDIGTFRFSQNFCGILGLTSIQKPRDFFHLIHPADRSMVTDTFNLIHNLNEFPEYEFRLINDEKPVYIHQSGKRYSDSKNGNYLYGFWKDITRQKEKEHSSFFPDAITVSRENILHDAYDLQQLNNVLLSQNRVLKRRNAELHAFSYISSNDLKEPLRRIYTSIEMLLEQDLSRFSDKGRTHFKQIQGALQRLGLLADDIVYFSRLDAEKADFTNVDLNDVFSLALKRMEEQLISSRTFIRADDLPVYHGHRGMLVLLFQNLVSNAVKFQEPGSVPEIHISVEKQQGSTIKHPDADATAVYLVLHFADNGIGFDQKYKDRIFDVFMRINRGKYPGTGKGLALCKKIAELHGGFIIAESIPGSGSIFHCYLQEGL